MFLHLHHNLLLPDTEKKYLKMALQEARNFCFNLSLLPSDFVEGCALVAAKRSLNIDAVALSIILGTSTFLGKSQIQMEGSDKIDVASLWVCNIQVYLHVGVFCLHCFCRCCCRCCFRSHH